MSKKNMPPEERKTRILVVDDHPIVRERLAELIGQEPDLIVCAEAEDSVQALRETKAHLPQLAIVDITLKDTYGIELIKQLKELHPDLPVLVLSMHDESLYGERALRAGARGYLNKQDATKKIITAIRAILRGDVYVSDAMAASIVRRVAFGGVKAGPNLVDNISDREMEVLQLLGEGKTVREIAENLFISVKTVEAHREHIKRKLGFKNSTELLRYAVEFVLDERSPRPTQDK